MTTKMPELVEFVKSQSFTGLCDLYPMEVELILILGALLVLIVCISWGSCLVVCLHRKCSARVARKKEKLVRKILAANQPEQCKEAELTPARENVRPKRTYTQETGALQESFMGQRGASQVILGLPLSFPDNFRPCYPGYQSNDYSRRSYIHGNSPGFLESAYSTLPRLGKLVPSENQYEDIELVPSAGGARGGPEPEKRKEIRD